MLVNNSIDLERLQNDWQAVINNGNVLLTRMNFVGHSFRAEREKQKRVMQYRRELYKTGLVISHTDNYCLPSQSVGVSCFSSVTLQVLHLENQNTAQRVFSRAAACWFTCFLSLWVWKRRLSLSSAHGSAENESASLTLHTECCFSHWLILFHIIDFRLN